MTNQIKCALLTLLLLVFANPAQSGHHGEGHHEKEKHDEDHEGESLEAHNHGIAELFIVLEGRELQIELHTPAANLVGFEHEAKNAEQKAQVESAKQTLENASDLFQISSGACELSDYELDLGDLAGEETAHDDEEHHDDEDGDDKHHEDEHHDDADEDHDEVHNDENTHSDIEAEYHYNCAKPDSISSLVTAIPDAFPGVESLEVQWIVNGRQGAIKLEKDQREVVFK